MNAKSVAKLRRLFKGMPVRMGYYADLLLTWRETDLDTYLHYFPTAHENPRAELAELLLQIYERDRLPELMRAFEAIKKDRERIGHKIRQAHYKLFEQTSRHPTAFEILAELFPTQKLSDKKRDNLLRTIRYACAEAGLPLSRK
jgi:hypothetical protein